MKVADFHKIGYLTSEGFEFISNNNPSDRIKPHRSWRMEVDTKRKTSGRKKRKKERFAR
jgi:hypothetical protein